MSVSRRVGFSLVFVSIFLAGVSPAFAHPGTSETHQTVVEPVSWTLSASACAVLQSDLSGIGTRHEEINTKVNADGSMRIVTNDSVKGTASDSSATYEFSYENHTIELVPSGAGAHQVSMVDSFVVEGKGPAGHLNVGFNWRWTYTPPEQQWPPVHNWQKITTRGDSLTCDPI